MARAEAMRARVARARPAGGKRTMNSAAPARVAWIMPTAIALAVIPLVAGRIVATPLGVPHPPFVGDLAPDADPLLAVSVACFAAAVALAPRLLSARAAWFAAGACVLALVLRLVLAAGGGGRGGAGIAAWWKVFDPARSYEAPNEYLPALGALRWGPRFLLDRFAETVPALPVHAAGHPPGMLLALDALGIESPGGMAALCIGVGALGVPLAYLLGRQVLDEPRARLAALLLAFAPGALLFGATSADAVYLTLGLLAAWPLAARSWRARSAGAVALAVSSLFAWSLLAVGPWAALLAWRREGLRAALALSALCGVVLAAFYAALYAGTGFDPIGTLRATEDVYRAGIAAVRPYWYWLLGSPAAFLLVLGLPISWYALRALAAGRTLAVAIFAVLAFAAVMGFTKAETERIWLFFAPFVCLAAASGPAADVPLRPLLALLAVQALAYEFAFDTIW
jgi:methylthioxylose transferase